MPPLLSISAFIRTDAIGGSRGEKGGRIVFEPHWNYFINIEEYED